MILFILDLIGPYQGICNLKCTRKRNFEWLHFLWQVVQNYKFAKSQEKPHKMLILNREVRPPTLNFWYFFWFRMVPYGPNINVPGFPKFFSWKVAFLQHSSAQAADFYMIEGILSFILFIIIILMGLLTMIILVNIMMMIIFMYLWYDL